MKFHTDQSKENTKNYYGWVIASFGNMVIALTTITSFQGTGFFLKAFEEQKNWSRTLISGASSFARAESALLGPVEGFLLEKFGVKRIMVIGNFIAAFGFVLMAYTDTVLQLFFAYFFVSFGSALCGWLPIMTLMNMWFEKNKTFAMAFSITGTHIGGWVAPLLAFCLFTFGIKNTALFISVVFILFSPLSFFIVRDKTNFTKNKLSTKQNKKKFSFKINLNPEIKKQLTQRPFWIIAFTHMCSTTSIVTLTTHLPAHITDLGFSVTTAGYIVSIFSTVGIFSQYIAGYTADKYGKKYILLIFLLFQVSALVVLSIFETWTGLVFFAILWGIGFGGRTPVITAIRGDYFHPSVFATLFGFSGIIINIGTTAGPIIAGILYDNTGSYEIAFRGLYIIAFIGCLLLLTLPTKNKTQNLDK
jgi:MFS family permease